MTPLDLGAVQDPSSLIRRIEELAAQLRDADPARLAANTGAVFHEQESELRLSIFGQPVAITVPDYLVLDRDTREEPHVYTQALLLYHLSTCSGVPLSGRWISFRELPSGGFYHQAFQGYTGREIVRAFGDDLAVFGRAAEELGGRREELGDAAYVFAALPRVPLLVVYWLGEETFPSSAQILFDESAGQQLPTDACALLGSLLARRLIGRRESGGLGNRPASPASHRPVR